MSADENGPGVRDLPAQSQETPEAEPASGPELPEPAEQAQEETRDQQPQATTPTAPPPVRTEPDSPASGQGSANLDLMMELPLEVVVELGQATLPLSTVLSLGPGSVIELTRRPGEPLDLYVNGQLVARGEVVVLNETFGFRVTEVVSPAELKMLGH